MKKLVKSVLMLSIASLAILSSCKKDDANAEVTDVKVDITSTPASPVQEGTPITLTITCTGNTDNKLKSISVTRTQGSVEKTLLSKSLTGTSVVETIIDSPETGSYTYTVAVTGEKGSPATKVLTVNTVPAPGPLNVTSSAVPLFAQNNGAGSNANFMQLVFPFGNYSNAVFTANKANIDLVYYYGQTNKATLASPSDAQMQQQIYSGLDWTGTNATGLYKTSLTVAQFDAIVASNSDAQITSMAASVTAWSTLANVLSQGNIILYKTASGKLGLIKVESLGGTSSTDGTVNLIVAAQD